VLSTKLTDDGPVYNALSVHLSRAKLFGDRYGVAKLSPSPEFRKQFLLFVDNCISLKHSVVLVERSLRAKNQINPFTPFDRRPTCDRQTQGHS